MRKKGIGGEGVVLAPRLATEKISVARRCEEREKMGERRERGERGREKREGHHERRRRMCASGKFPLHA